MEGTQLLQTAKAYVLIWRNRGKPRRNREETCFREGKWRKEGLNFKEERINKEEQVQTCLEMEMHFNGRNEGCERDTKTKRGNFFIGCETNPWRQREGQSSFFPGDFLSEPSLYLFSADRFSLSPSPSSSASPLSLSLSSQIPETRQKSEFLFLSPTSFG